MREAIFESFMKKQNEEEMNNSYKINTIMNDVSQDLVVEANGGCLNIYEPYLFEEKFAAQIEYGFQFNSPKLHNDIFVDLPGGEKNVKIDTKKMLSKKVMKHSSKNAFTLNKEIVNTNPETSKIDEKKIYFVKPFRFKQILKLSNYKEMKSLKSMYVNFDKNIKSEIIKVKRGRYKNLHYTYDLDENGVMNGYIYCPFLFLNSTDSEIKLTYKKNLLITNLPSEFICENSILCNQKTDSEINSRVKMFFPENNKNFKFRISGDTIHTTKKLEIFDIANQGKNLHIKQKKESHLNESLRQTLHSEIADDRKYRLTNQNQFTRIANVEKGDRDIYVSSQMIALRNSLKFSKLIFMTPSIYIYNTTNRDIHLYHFYSGHHQEHNHHGSNQNSPIKIQTIRGKQTVKFYNLKNFFEFIKISFEDKPNYEDPYLYSGLIRTLANNEFYLTLGDRDK